MKGVGCRVPDAVPNPATQKAQSPAPTGEKVEKAHPRQSPSETPPASLLNVPAGQRTHGPSPLPFLTDPGEQRLHPVGGSHVGSQEPSPLWEDQSVLLRLVVLRSSRFPSRLSHTW